MTGAAAESGAPRPGTTHPRLARERALKVLFAADVRGVDPRRLLDEVERHEPDLELLDELEPDQEQVAGDEDLQLELTRRRRLPLDDYTRLLVDGVAARQHQIDDLLGEVADNWQVHRMPSVDRNLLRLGIYELAEQDTPPAVVIDEAVSLAVAFAGDKARSFVNGVLETVRKMVAAGEVDLTPPAPEPTPEVDEAATDAPAAAPPGEDAQVTADDEDVSEPDVTSDDLAEVDTAAQEAYDLALDLLEAEGPLDEYADTDRDGPEETEEFADADEDLRYEEVSFDDLEDADTADEDGPQPDDLRDEDDALW